MDWNIRLVDLSHTNGGEPWLVLCEVMYENDVPVAYTEACLGSETVEGAREIANWCATAASLPVLTMADFKGMEDTRLLETFANRVED